MTISKKKAIDILKNEWRQVYRQQRQCLAKTLPNLYNDYCASISKTLERVLKNINGYVASYIAFDGEIDLSGFNAMLMKQKRLLLPAINSEENKLNFYEVKSFSQMQKSSLGFDQPMPKDEPIWPAVVLMPLVAYGAEGARLGFGKGYYDHTFAAVESRPILIGVGYSMSYCGDLRSEAHDVPLDAVVTEIGLESYGDSFVF
ncbi:MAG: 5-formyltetrahydrofolate cyclo-ligase [Rickettsiales bacterium]|nr:5-formyltetrahydrofolate cyclo-ligase [Rickettsiales bacterium]|tara:strand:+ start:10944 stop:11549 length:606 start_codon:yes stop_codon:yes gene_type:complete